MRLRRPLTTSRLVSEPWCCLARTARVILDSGCDRWPGLLVIRTCEAGIGASSPGSLPSGVLLQRSSRQANYPMAGKVLAHASMRAGSVQGPTVPNL